MNRPEKALAERIKELRRRQFGPRGKVEFARRLGVPAEEYERYERGTVPPGETLVRMCEATGEDLQWLLTGVAARGTVVISGTKSRHQALLTRLAQLLDGTPEFAAPVEAFVDLLVSGEEARAEVGRGLPLPAPGHLIPIFEAHELPFTLPGTGEPEPGDGFPLSLPDDSVQFGQREPAALAEPAAEYAGAALRRVELISVTGADGQTRQCVHSPDVAGCFPGIFGVRLQDDAMTPMFRSGDAALVAVGAEPKIGRPVLCRLRDEPEVRCRVWLGEQQGAVNLGRLSDGELERVDAGRVCWSLEVLYRLPQAA